MRFTGCGGIIKDFMGRWVAGFTCNLGICSSVVAEMWGILEGPKLAKRIGFKKIIIESDSKVVVEKLNKRG